MREAFWTAEDCGTLTAPHVGKKPCSLREALGFSASCWVTWVSKTGLSSESQLRNATSPLASRGTPGSCFPLGASVSSSVKWG